MRRDDDFEEDWVGEATTAIASAALGEFERYRRSLLPKPPTLYTRVRNAVVSILSRLMGFVRKDPKTNK